MRSRSLELRDPSGGMSPHDDSSSDSDIAEEEDLAEQDVQVATAISESAPNQQDPHRWWKFFIRSLALTCAMALSIGSHFGSYFLGPLKSRLSREIGTNNAQFSLLIAAFDLNSTWTPLVGGLLVCRFGTARSSIVATFAIFLGQVVLLIGDLLENVLCMSVGLFIFGLGISPLAVVQETIVVRFFASHGLGISLAIGLIAGKGASFLSARISYPVSQKYGPHAPFVLATLLALFSFGINLIYLSCSSWLARSVGVQLEPGEEEKRPDILGARMTAQEATIRVTEKRIVRLKDMQRFGDVFWLYLAINVLCGAIWSPFTHLASNIIEQRYALSEAEASRQASLLLAGSLFLYPICGLLTDRLKYGSTVFALFTLSALLTLICYGWVVVPPSWTKTPMPAMLSFSGGHGFSTLLLVILVPHLLPLSHVSTGLGAHKSIEKAGSTISQTLAGLILDLKGHKHDPSSDKTSISEGGNSLQSIQRLLVVFFVINIVQFLGTLLLWRDGAYLQTHPRHTPSTSTSIYHPIASEDIAGPSHGQPSNHRHSRRGTDVSESALLSATSDDEESHPRGRQSDGALLAGHLRTDGSWSRRTKPLLINSNVSHTNYSSYSSALASPVRNRNHPTLTRSFARRRRGKIYMTCFFSTILISWVIFMTTAIIKINGPRKH
ncbi:hypothetical protein FRC14_005606 [Serendipita sp. 396]|nr:hypothetical protein FRC14_005606 [Serendipita sp. 396]KAG8828041.1 hypothetical protein FRC19_009897 [Serendipita sp. 401]KAG9058345.1 hypothetical protein FS842_010071 [Serendipita sp. 407]